MITNNGKGNPELANLPRKLNIGLSPSRDDFPHTHINDVGLKAVHDPETGEVTHPLPDDLAPGSLQQAPSQHCYACLKVMYTQRRQTVLPGDAL